MTPIVFALASCLATLTETLVFNHLTVLRTFAHANQAAPANVRSFAALPIQLVCVLLRRPFNLGVQVALSGSGMHPAVAGAAAGALEGVLFTPTRKIQCIQLGAARRLRVVDIARTIYRSEGLGGFWRGGLVNIVRCATAGLIYFAIMTGCQANMPQSGAFVHGAISAAAATLVLNPFEVFLTRLYLGRPAAETPRDLARGLGLCLARNVPGGALRWWLTQTLARWWMS